MIIYNTTFHIENDIVDECTNYIKTIYIPAIIQSGFLAYPRFHRILTKQDEQEGSCFSLQFSVKNMDTLNYWLEKEGFVLLQNLTTHFKNRVLPFSTLLDEIDLEQ